MLNRLLILTSALVTLAHAELTATFTSGEASDVRYDRLPAILVKEGETPTPFLGTGPFEVKWTGKLVTEERMRLYFSFEGEGNATLTLNGEEVLSEDGTLGEAESERIRLNPGEHDISIHYKSKEDGSGRFRLFWKERSFPMQSIPASAFKTEVKPTAKRHGRAMFAANHCAKCHLPEQGLGASPMGEIQETAPLLMNTGARLNEEWLTEWIASPSSIKPDTRMPELVDGSTEEGLQQAADMAAWLMTLKIADTPEAPAANLAEKGGEHFHKLGCVACHSRPDTTEMQPGRIPLQHVGKKYQPGALVEFLKKPDQWAPHTNMPDFGLSDDEANAIATWLIQESSKVKINPPKLPKGDAVRGAELAKELNCGACHAGSPLDLASVPPLESIFKNDWDKEGCLTGKAGLPHFNLTDDELSHLKIFSKSGHESLKRHSPAEYATRQLKEQKCTSCHSIDGKSSLLDTYHIETKELVAHVGPEDGKLDQSRPHLSYIGEMLYTSYIESMIDGKERARPWLDMRMPAYHSRAKPLAEGLARIHGVEPASPEEPEIDTELAKIGEQLIGAEGFGCNTCHGIGDTKPTAAFEVEGLNFALAHKRLRKEWYMRWMDNPLSVTPNTKMPRYSERGESQRTDILDGNAEQQFNAIWHYLMSVSDEK